MAFADSEGTRIYYDDRGKGEPVLLCLPGWCVHHTMFVPLAERLSAQHRVLVMDWRGHGKSQASDRDFGYAEMLADVLAVIQASGAQSVIPIAQAHGGWVAIELRRRLDQRVPKMVFTSWNPIFTSGDPLAAPFLRAMQALRDNARWRETVEQIFTMWLSEAPASVDTHIRNEMGSHGFDDWARAGREIVAMYAREGNPLQALSELSPPVAVLHVYAQPRVPEYLSTQESFARDHPWFAVRRLEAASHFPTLEVPDETAGVIREFIH
ncbi:MAG: alpha/beta hydrolase [Armatimonadetes bacterium]|nr:alpha/beta hydrolase [Armatimonadota bacterium]MBI2972558.1 alpha/beta hydrolase [Armatimonadota bacterium]